MQVVPVKLRNIVGTGKPKVSMAVLQNIANTAGFF